MRTPDSDLERGLIPTDRGSTFRFARSLVTGPLACVVAGALACVAAGGAESPPAAAGKAAPAKRPAAPAFDPVTTARNEAYAKQLEGYLLKWLVDDYPERAAKAWQRDYSSVDAFVRSV